MAESLKLSLREVTFLLSIDGSRSKFPFLVFLPKYLLWVKSDLLDGAYVR